MNGLNTSSKKAGKKRHSKIDKKKVRVEQTTTWSGTITLRSVFQREIFAKLDMSQIFTEIWANFSPILLNKRLVKTRSFLIERKKKLETCCWFKHKPFPLICSLCGQWLHERVFVLFQQMWSWTMVMYKSNMSKNFSCPWKHEYIVIWWQTVCTCEPI